MKLKLPLQLMACLGCLFLAGCGGSTDSAPASTASSDDMSAPEGDPGMGGEMPVSDMDAMAGEEAMMAAEMSAEGGPTGDPAAGMDPAMMEAALGEDPSLYAGGEQVPQRPPRPENIADWTPEHVAEAIADSDKKVLEAIQLFARKSQGDAAAVEQLQAWMTALTAPARRGPQGGEFAGTSGEFAAGEAMPEMAGMAEMSGMEGMSGFGPGGGPGHSVKHEIARTLIDALTMNGTPAAYAVVQNVLQGKVDLGIDQAQSMEFAMGAMLKNISAPNNPGRDLLRAALTMDAVSIPTGKTSEGQPQVKTVSVAEKAKELHLGFAIAAMNGLIGADAVPAKRPGGGQQFGMMSGEMMADPAMMEGNPGGMAAPAPGGPPSTAKPVKLKPLSLNREESRSALSYLWAPELINLAASQLTQQPDSPEAFVFAAAFPTAQTREAVQNALSAHQNQPPGAWLHESAFETQLADPALLVFLKSLPRELRPQTSPGQEGPQNAAAAAAAARRRAKRGSKGSDDDPEAKSREAARYGWMDVSDEAMLAVMQRMYEGSVKPEAAPFEASELPLELHRGAEVTNSLRFALPEAAAGASTADAAEMTIVNYVRIESPQMNQKTVLHYRNALRDEETVTILGGNGMWLDGGVKPNGKNGTRRSIDVLLSKGNSRPSIRPQQQPTAGGFDAAAGFSGEPGAAETQYAGEGFGGGNGEVFVVELLVVEIPAQSAEDADGAVSLNNQ